MGAAAGLAGGVVPAGVVPDAVGAAYGAVLAEVVTGEDVTGASAGEAYVLEETGAGVEVTGELAGCTTCSSLPSAHCGAGAARSTRYAAAGRLSSIPAGKAE